MAVCLCFLAAVGWWIVLAGAKPHGQPRKRLTWDDPPGSGKMRPFPKERKEPH